jgi:hypothetical protein
LKVPVENVRSVVKYISAPTASGKSSSIFPAFVKSIGTADGGDVYLYLAFTNNGQTNFTMVARHRQNC